MSTLVSENLKDMNQRNPTVVFLSGSMQVGGTSMFALNACMGMRESGGWRGIAAGLREFDDVGPQIRSLGLEFFNPMPTSVIHEQRLEDIYRDCARISARAVVAGVSGDSFEFLRFVPSGCLRIGMIQSDDECVYQMISHYLPWLDIIVGVSLEICRKMEARLGGIQIPVIHQPYGVPMPSSENLRSTIGPLRVLYLGRVADVQKRACMMARIMQATLSAQVDIEWTIAGDGPALPRMKGEFAEFTDRVNFPGFVSYSHVPQVLANHDVYFLCSDFEGLPLSLLEAMGAGLVPVVSDLPSGISEVVNDENGIRIAIDDESGYADALVNLARNRARLAPLSHNAARTVRHSHSYLAMARRWEAMLDTHHTGHDSEWGSRCSLKPPLNMPHGWLFHPFVRPFRVAAKRFMETFKT
jgi:glycosyltransferase involved in cell wall biosynthesis